MDTEQKKEIKDHVRFVCNVGYALADLVGVACGISIGRLLYAMQVNALVITLVGLAVAGITAAIECAIVWAMSQPYYTDNGEVNLVLHIILSIFVGGIWNWFWVSHTTYHLNRVQGEYHRPVCKLLLYMFIPFYSIYWYYKQGKRLDALSKCTGADQSGMTAVYVILGVFIPVLANILMQYRVNKIAQCCKTHI